MAIFYDYENRTAFNPETGEGTPNAVGQVYAKTDTTFSTPLVVTLMGSGLTVTDLTTDQYCQLQGFQAADLVQVVFKSGDFTKVLNTTTPLVGPAGPAVSDAVDNGDGTVTFTLPDGSPAATVALPPGPQGDPGPAGLPATGAADDDAAIKTFMTTPGTATNTALSATIVSEVEAGVEPVKDVLPRAASARRPFPAVTMVSAMQSGHGWTINSSNSQANLNDTTDFVLGSQAVSFQTTFTAFGTSAYISSPAVALNMTGKGLLIWIKLETADLSTLDDLAFIQVVAYSGAGTTNYFRAQIGSQNSGPIKPGEWTPWRIPWANFEATKVGTTDRANITSLRVIAAEKTGRTPIRVKVGGVATYNETSAAYPSGVVSLTFDDSFATAYTVGIPKLSVRGWAGTLFPIIDRLDTPGYLTTAQVRNMQDIYGWEIGAHASSVAAHGSYRAKTPEQIETELSAIRAWQNNNGFQSSSFAYPVGDFNTATRRQVQRHYESAASTATIHDSLKGSDPQLLGRHTVGPSLTLASAQKFIDEAVAGKSWLKLCFHDLVASGPTGTSWTIADFNSLMDYIASSGLTVVPVRDVMATLTA